VFALEPNLYDHSNSKVVLVEERDILVSQTRGLVVVYSKTRDGTIGPQRSFIDVEFVGTKLIRERRRSIRR